MKLYFKSSAIILVSIAILFGIYKSVVWVSDVNISQNQTQEALNKVDLIIQAINNGQLLQILESQQQQISKNVRGK